MICDSLPRLICLKIAEKSSISSHCHVNCQTSGYLLLLFSAVVRVVSILRLSSDDVSSSSDPDRRIDRGLTSGSTQGGDDITAN